MKHLLITLFCLTASLQLIAGNATDSASGNCADAVAIYSKDSTLLTIKDTVAADSMKIVCVSWKQGGCYTQNGKTYSRSQLAGIMKANPKAQRTMKRARVCTWISAPIVFCLGGVLCALPFTGDSIGEVAAVGLGLAAVGIPLSMGATKLERKAIHIYNSSLN